MPLHKEVGIGSEVQIWDLLKGALAGRLGLEDKVCIIGPDQGFIEAHAIQALTGGAAKNILIVNQPVFENPQSIFPYYGLDYCNFGDREKLLILLYDCHGIILRNPPVYNKSDKEVLSILDIAKFAFKSGKCMLLTLSGTTHFDFGDVLEENGISYQNKTRELGYLASHDVQVYVI